ncbi:MAG: SUMF1/EgtB/PvdO family nonheme iron enzyme [Chitinispirillaceae bacterium]|nr:SUMF1/EgtB/PvdO family nonheme iron enzyme [Chitinispirillaceae bacterium]
MRNYIRFIAVLLLFEGLHTISVAQNNFTEEVEGVSFDMIYVPGGTFTLGCESNPCPANTAPVSGVKVSSYYIAKNEVTAQLWKAVMGSSSGLGGTSDITWYKAMEFACLLSTKTGKNYRMPTEAEWEYAAKKHLSSLEDIGKGEEWTYNSWNSTHMGGTDPLGPYSGRHTQKTRRDAQNTGDNITGRLIRSIDGIGPKLRLVISADTDFPPDYIPPCKLHPPVLGPEPENSYRDPRWITGSDSNWTGDFSTIRVWEDGTARLGSKNGQWFTSNNIAFVFVPASGDPVKFAYVLLDETQGSVISNAGFMRGGFFGRIFKEKADNLAKPAVANLKSGAELAAAAGDEYRMVDMENIPESARKQDERLIDGPGYGWSQKNVGSVHHYRKDVDRDEFRFTVNQMGDRTMLANGKWFTVGNTFLRVTHPDGYTCEYLYTVNEDGNFYHNSFQKYERADFRMFTKETNGPDFNDLCGDICSNDIPKGQPASVYAILPEGVSTFAPAPCPTGGCDVAVTNKQNNNKLPASLMQNVYYVHGPNGVSIHYELKSDCHVRLSVFDIQGKKIKTLSDGPLPAGTGNIPWNERNFNGGIVSPGLYVLAFEIVEKQYSMHLKFNRH